MNRWATVLLGTILVGCTPDAAVPPSTSTTQPPVTTTTAANTDEICRIGDLRFADSGLVAAVGEDIGDASTITEIRWDDSATCERVTFTFASDSGAPAGSLGQIAVSMLPSSGVVRIILPAELTTTAVADVLPEGDLANRVFVIRDDEGALSVDIHATPHQPIAARAFVTEAPATLIVDIVPSETTGGQGGAVMSPVAILVTPAAGPTIYPFSVEGYAAPGTARTRIQLTRGSSTQVDTTLALRGWTDAWQSFATSVPDGPSGQVALFVGSLNESGIQSEGAIVTLDLP
jgi:hypothetical protein